MNEDTQGRPWSFQDLPPHAFPLKLEAFNAETGERVWCQDDIQPYVAVEVPSLQKVAGGPVRVRVTTADGEYHDEWPQE